MRHHHDPPLDERDWTRIVKRIIIGVVIFFIASAIWARGPGVIALIEELTRGAAPFWIWVTPVLVTAGLIVRKYFKQEFNPHTEHRPDPSWKSLIYLAVVAVISTTYVLGVHRYLTDVAWADGVQTVDETVTYQERSPWYVATRYASRDQGDVIGERGPVRHVPGTDTTDMSRYATAITARSFAGLAGYEAVQTMNMPILGQIGRDATTYCEVPDHMGRKLHAFWPQHDLDWAIYAQRPNAHFDASDMYAYCDGEDPVVVIPLWAYDGFWTVTKVPAGVAVYTVDGLEVYSAREMDDLDVHGPTYPTSVAADQRDGLRGMFSFGQYYSRTAGYDATSKDVADTNWGNDSEFILVSEDNGNPDYVTPMTPRGSSQSITALAVVPARQDGTGRIPVTVNTSVDLPATSTIATNIRESSINGDASWASRWAADMKIYEMLPGRDGAWVASIGQGQAVSYRASISPEGLVTVTNVTTGQSTVVTGGDGTQQQAPDGTTTPGVTLDGKSVTDMTDEELLILLGEVVEEMEARQVPGETPAP